jgi:hypothetical protein
MNGWANWYGNWSYPSTHVFAPRADIDWSDIWAYWSIKGWESPLTLLIGPQACWTKVHCHVLEAIIDERNFIKIISRNNLTKLLLREAIRTNLILYSIYYDLFWGKAYFSNLLSRTRNAFLSSSTCLLHTWAFQTYRKYNMGPPHVSIDDVC